MNAREYLREAVAIDPGFAEAWVALASHSCMLAVLHLPANMESERAAAIEELNVALEKALALDDSSSLAHSVQGIVHAQLDWDWARVEQEHLRAIEHNPSSPDAHSAYAGLLAALGRFEESFVEAALAEELDPFSADVLREIGAIYYWAHDYPRSLQYLDRAQELAPGSIYNESIKGWVFGAAGREKEAVRSWQKMQGMLGQNDEAIEWLEKGFASRDDPGETAGWRFIYLKVDPNYGGLHGDRRLQDLLRRMNLAD